MPYRSVAVRGIALLCFPPVDSVFEGVVRRLAEALDPLTAADLEAHLKPHYPDAVVRGRESLASFDGPAFYVYRDGRYSPYDPGPNWWEAPGAARIVLTPEGRYVDANAAALALLNCSLDELLASSPGDFTVERHRPNVPWIMQLLRDTGELHSTVMMQPRGGRPVQPVEYHLVVNGDGAGNVVSWIRPVPTAAVVEAPPAEAAEAPPPG